MMRVLMVHNYYRYSGGEDVVYEAEMDLLRKHGHEVFPEEYRNTSIQDERPVRDSLALAIDTVWSRSGHRRFRQIIDEFRPDVAHFHNTFPLVSPSAYSACSQAGVPVVQTLHNYRMFCPSATFFRDGRVCQDCFGRVFAWPGILHACYRHSRSETSTVAAMQSVHRARRTWTRDVDIYIALSEHSKRVFARGGIPAHRIMVKPNFVARDFAPGDHSGGFALFVGRLSEEKGIATLLTAWSDARIAMNLKIVGDGPLEPDVRSADATNPRVEWLGRRTQDEIYNLLGKASLLVFPSEWYETFGRTIIEAYARGTPVVASRIGSTEELIRPGETGLYFRAGDPADLVSQIETLSRDLDTLQRLGEGARRVFESEYTADRNYDLLLDVYQTAVRSRQNIPQK